MAQTFTYSIANDTAEGAVSARKLDAEIRSSSVTVALSGVSATGDVLTIAFKADLSAQEETDLNALVAAHDGVAPAKLEPPLRSDGTPIIHLDAPEDPRDRKPVVVVSPASEGMNTWLTSRGDDTTADPIASGRGLGGSCKVEFETNESGVKYSEWQFTEPVEVHDGQVWWTPSGEWGPDDSFELMVRIPGNDPSSTPGTGNLNAVDLGGGAAYLYVPAAGDGSHTLDMTTAVPIFAPMGDGWFDVDHYTGVVTPNTNQTGAWNLVSFEIQSWLIPSIYCGHPGGWFDVDVYKTEWVHQNWIIRLSANRDAQPSTKATIGGWLLVFRQNITRM